MGLQHGNITISVTGRTQLFWLHFRSVARKRNIPLTSALYQAAQLWLTREGEPLNEQENPFL